MAQENELKLQNVKFTKTLRGYAFEEVDTYVAYVTDRYNTLVREYVEVRRKMAAMAAGQNEFREDALREKEKIAAEAEAMYQEKKAEADKLVEDAMRKAARILSEAETAAAGILKRAETEADKLAETRRAEEAKAIAEAEQALAERNNAAERLVEEIDSFRGEVFAMYGRHIEELERLARLTDRFYQDKEDLAGALLPETEEDSAARADVPESEADEEVYMTPEAAGMVAAAEVSETEEIYEDPAVTEDPFMEDPFADTFAEEPAGEETDLLRIDWKKHRAGRENDAPEEVMEDTEWEIPEEADDGEDSDFLWTDPDEDADALGAGTEEDSLLSEDFEEPDDFPPEEEDDGDGEESAAPVPVSEEEFLSGITSEYMRPKTTGDKPAKKAQSARPAQPTAPVKSGDLDDLFYDEEAKNVSLTGEFDKIFSSKNSAANVAQIDRQPLVSATKPEKPKKHGNGTNK